MNRRIDNTFDSDKNIIWYYLKNVCTNWLFSKEDVNIYIIVLIDESIMNHKKKNKKNLQLCNISYYANLKILNDSQK